MRIEVPLRKDVPGLRAGSAGLSALPSASYLMGAELGAELTRREEQSPGKNCERAQVGRTSWGAEGLQPGPLIPGQQAFVGNLGGNFLPFLDLRLDNFLSF